jgi:hypothetical protein
MKRRQLLLGGALALTLAAVWWAAGVETEEAGDAPHMATTAPARANARRADVRVKLDLAPLSAVRSDYGDRAPTVFGLPPPPPRPVAQRVVNAAPPKPRAPALPYTYIGSLQEDGGARMVFLLDGERLVTAQVGDVLDTNYRVAAADADGITLIYLPLKETQRIALTDTP